MWVWLDTWIVILFLTLVDKLLAKKVYLDKYGDCFHDDFFKVEAGETFTIFSRGGEPYDTTLCEMHFKSVQNDRLCLSFDNFDVHNCNVRLAIYSDETSKKNEIGDYGCDTPETPGKLCSDGRHLTVKMTKKELSHQGYSFRMKVREYSRTLFADGFDFLSIGIIISIVVAVAVFLVMLAALIVCCGWCGCKSQSLSINSWSSRKSTTSGNTQFTEVPIVPTAPPLDEDPPAYQEQPPPYTETAECPPPSSSTAAETSVQQPSAPLLEDKCVPEPV